MRFRKDDLVVIRESVFPDKVGKVGVVTSADPGLDNPYEVAVFGGTGSRFSEGTLRPVTVAEISRMHNDLHDRILEREAAPEAGVPSGPPR